MRGVLVGLLALVPALGGAQDRAPPATDNPQPTTQFIPQRLSAFDRQTAEWLLQERLPCLGCHRLNERGGTIGPDLTGVADRRTASFIFRMIVDPQATLAGSRMPRVPMPASWSRLIASYLAEARGPDAAPQDPSGSPDTSGLKAEQDAAALYQRLCAACHGAEGRGDGVNATNLPVRPTAHADSAYMSLRPDDTLFDGVFAGGYILNQSHFMPAWGETLSRQQIRGLVRYMRGLCRCAGPEWSRR